MTRTATAAHRILIVEDDDDSRTLLGHLLTVHGYQIALARNGLEGIHAARECRPDLILLDLQMPVMDGFAFRQQQVATRGLADVPVVCVSALDLAAPDLRRLGDVQFVRKPIDFDHLVMVITEALSAPTVAIARPARHAPPMAARQ